MDNIKIGEAPAQITSADNIPTGAVVPMGGAGVESATDVSIDAISEKARKPIQNAVDTVSATALNLLPDWGRMGNGRYSYTASFTAPRSMIPGGDESFNYDHCGLRQLQFASIGGHKFTVNSSQFGGRTLTLTMMWLF